MCACMHIFTYLYIKCECGKKSRNIHVRALTRFTLGAGGKEQVYKGRELGIKNVLKHEPQESVYIKINMYVYVYVYIKKLEKKRIIGYKKVGKLIAD